MSDEWTPTPKASRFIARATALNALGRYEQRLRARLDTPGIDEDEMADLSNDLGFVCSLIRGLSKGKEDV